MAFSTTCDKTIANHIEFSCANLPLKGFSTDGVIVNRADVDFDNITAAPSGSDSFTDFPLKAGAKGYKLIMPENDPFTGTQITLNVGTNFNTFDKAVSFIVFDDPTNATALDALAHGEFVIVLRKKKVGGYSYPIYGMDSGLKATEIVKDYYSDDTNGAAAVTLTETGAPVAERYLIDTTPGTIETILTTIVA